jgi:transposase-like protein
MTVLIAICCPQCHSTEIVKYGQSSNGKQRFRCLNSECPRLTFSLDLAYPGLKSQVKQQIIEMTLNGSGVRDIARVLHVSPATVINELKKKKLNSNQSIEPC